MVTTAANQQFINLSQEKNDEKKLYKHALLKLSNSNNSSNSCANSPQLIPCSPYSAFYTSASQSPLFTFPPNNNFHEEWFSLEGYLLMKCQSGGK